MQGHIARNCPQRKQWPWVSQAFSNVVNDWSIAEMDDSNLHTVSSIASRIKGMTEEEKEEFICLMNDEE